MLEVDQERLEMPRDERVTAPDGRAVSLAEVCLRGLYGADQFQIGATASPCRGVAPAVPGHLRRGRGGHRDRA